MSVVAPEKYVFDEFLLDIARRALFRNGEALPLTPKVFATLECLVEKRGNVVSKDELMAAVWPDTVVEENNLNQNISTLRRLLGESRGQNRYIATVPGKGYQFVAQVTTAEAQLAEVGGENPARVARRSSFGGVRWWLMVAGGAGFALAILALAYYFWPRRLRHDSSGEVRSLAILPFKPVVMSQNDEVLELGMADTLITKLSNVGDLTIRPVALVRRFTDPQQDPATVGRELQVDAVLDGSIEEYAGRLRVTVRLVRTADGRQIWSDKFDEGSSDIFAVQDSISERVAAELAGKLTREEKALLAKRYTADTEAYDAYLRGNYFWEKRTPEGTRKAIDYFQQALARDPNYALAYAGIANCYSTMPISTDVPPRDAFPKAKEAAMRALAIDERLAEGHIALAYVSYFFDWDWPKAEKEYERALEINPNSPAAHWQHALLLSSLGKHDDAISEIDRAIRLEPLWPMTGALKGHVLFQARRYPEAIDYLLKTLELDNNFWITHIELGKSYQAAGQYAQALQSFGRAHELSQVTSETISLRGYTYAVSGDGEQARKMLRELEALARQRYVPPYNFALLYMGLGNSAQALRWLEKAYREKDVHMVFLGVDPKWDQFRSDSRFVRLADQLNLGVKCAAPCAGKTNQ